jgi:hypothetical protein
MGRPILTVRTIGKHISLPEPLNVRLEKELYSEAEQRIPFGAQQALFISLLEQYFRKLDKIRAKAAVAESVETANSAVEGG